MVQGTIRRVNSWKNQKGFFFLLNEVEGEWFSYGMPTFKIGDHVQFEPMSRKLNKATQVKIQKSVISPAPNDVVEEYFENSHTLEAALEHQKKPNRDDTITRLACLKAAASCMSGNGKELTSEAIANHTKTIADIFVKWVRS